MIRRVGRSIAASSASSIGGKDSKALASVVDAAASKVTRGKRARSEDVVVTQVGRGAIPSVVNAPTELPPTMKRRVEKGEGKGMVTREVPSSKKSGESFLIGTSCVAPMAKSIQREYNGLVGAASRVHGADRTQKKISGTGGIVSVADVIAYQIGWVKRVIEWYETGIKGKMPEMPGDGFTTWDYTSLARHFYKAYQYDSGDQQAQEFRNSVERVIALVEKEAKNGNLDKEGVWPWATLKSGKQWPLSKWVQVNTVAPFKKAAVGIRSVF